MQYLYAPGCALMSYKPHLAERLKDIIADKYGQMDTLLSCCFNKPDIDAGTTIITPCVTCANKYEALYPECKSMFFLKELAESDDFCFPDYRGALMSIQDTCDARTRPEYLETIRTLLKKMNIVLAEPEKSGARAKCCGQKLYGKTSLEKVEAFMKTRAEEMPCEDVVVYCASCIMSLTVGGKRPRYILDLLFGEPTEMKGAAIESWNKELIAFRNSH